ncbi:hypothetical protein CWO31_00160 [Vibrio splendidus]|uniref:phosphoribosyltransferase-like protein n=1 Tax=Vibrio lentus TaxID=136468 RepID=UPI000C8420A8|nr:hypothetical protein [Vibrio lentus]PMO05552.1 hypothetical protein BCT19_13880 [Vibrio splendidus]PTP68834.1 hypothetical protein CWO31_00160 [Vibrio splendidus]TKG17879.1 hypothetical protein FCW05_13340 [Vibrio lentus]
MNIPNNYKDLTEQSISKCKRLVQLKYWDNITVVKLMAWFNNFQSDEEKFLATCILESIIFRNAAAVQAFSSHIFHIMLPNILEELNIHEIQSLSEWESNLVSTNARNLLPFRFTTIEGIDRKTGKSGQALLRDVQRQYFDKELILSVETLVDQNFVKQVTRSKSFNTVVILDDVQVTGGQFSSFINKYDLSNSPFNYIYIPLAAFDQSLNDLNGKYSNIYVYPVETLSNEHSFFSVNNEVFNFCEPGMLEGLKSLYDSILKKNGIDMDEPYGYGDHALTYIFSNSTPNNNLGILSYQNENWNKLFTR